MFQSNAFQNYAFQVPSSGVVLTPPLTTIELTNAGSGKYRDEEYWTKIYQHVFSSPQITKKQIKELKRAVKPIAKVGAERKQFLLNNLHIPQPQTIDYSKLLRDIEVQNELIRIYKEILDEEELVLFLLLIS